jgi:hypothetical protein
MTKKKLSFVALKGMFLPSKLFQSGMRSMDNSKMGATLLTMLLSVLESVNTPLPSNEKKKHETRRVM